jgi:hypothetical protein
VARLFNSVVALVVMAAVVVAGPIGSGGVAAAAAAEGGVQESRRQRVIVHLPATKRIDLERLLAEGIAAAGIDLHDPAVQNQLAQTLGVSPAEIDRAVKAVDSGIGTLADSTPIALIFAPSIFRSVGGTLYGWLAEVAGVEGIEPF